MLEARNSWNDGPRLVRRSDVRPSQLVGQVRRLARQTQSVAKLEIGNGKIYKKSFFRLEQNHQEIKLNAKSFPICFYMIISNLLGYLAFSSIALLCKKFNTSKWVK